MLLADKNAIVYGSGSIGSAVARAFAREGAHVFLVGRTQAKLDEVAKGIEANGGQASVAVLDVLDAEAIEAHAAGVAEAGGIDIAFNATGNDDDQGTPLLDMDLDPFLRPVTKAITAHFRIATAVARHMKTRHSGVILCMAGGREAIPNLGGSHVAWSALTGLCRQLAAELGPHGIRAAWLLSPGSPEHGEAGEGPSAGDTLLGRLPTYDDVANVVVFAASDWARTMTATEINFTAGAVVD